MTRTSKGALAAAAVALAALLLWLGSGGPVGQGSPAEAARRVETGRATADPVPMAEAPSPEAPSAEAPPPSVTGEPSREWFLRVRTNPPGAVVRVWFLFAACDPDPPPVSKTTDGTGFAGFEIPAGGGTLRGIEIDARAPGLGARRFGMYGTTLPEKDSREIRIDLWPPAAAGVVLGSDGKPLKGALVRLGLHEPVWTDAEGRFETFARWEPTELHVSHVAHLRKSVEVPAPTADLVVRMERGLEVRGRVEFPDGRPVPGVEIQARVRWFARAMSGEDGTFLLSGLPEEAVTVRCPILGEERTAAPGGEEPRFMVKEHWVRLRMQDADGRPFRGALVVARGNPYNSDDRGWIGVRVPVGERLVAVPEVAGWSREPLEFTPEGEPRLHEVPFVLRPLGAPGALAIRAVDDSGRPLSRVFLSLPEHYRFADGFRDRPVDIDEAGCAVVEGVPPGAWSVHLAASKTTLPDPRDFAIPFTGGVRVESGREARVDAVLRTGGRIAVTVRGRDGEPVIPGALKLRDGAGEEVRAWFEGEKKDGTWTVAHYHRGRVLSFPALPAGRYALEVKPEGLESLTRDVEVASGSTVEVEFVLER